MKYGLVIILSALTFCLGCNRSKSPEELKTTLEENVLAVHDSAMSRMNSVYHLRKNLRALRDSLEAQPQPDSTILKDLHRHIQLLNRADEAMMNWMRQYKAPNDMDNKQAMSYLQQELVKIKEVQITMDSTIQAAKSTYKTYDDQNK